MSVPTDFAEASSAAAPGDVFNEALVADMEGKKQAMQAQEVIYDVANPSPIILGLVILCLFLVIYLLYTIMIKPNLSGVWTTKRGDRMQIRHGKFSNVLVIVSKGKPIHGSVKDNLVRIGNLIGIWNYSDVILFANGGSLTRIRG